MKKEAFLIYKTFYDPIKDMTNEQLGRLFRAIFNFQLNGTAKVEKDIRMAYKFFENQFKIDKKKYDVICLKNKENALKRWNATAYDRIRPNAMDADNDNENNNENENSINIPFDEFWDFYDKKIARVKCEKKWKKLKNSEREEIMKTLPGFLKLIKDKQYQPHPFTYLNQRRWEDEIQDDTEAEYKKMIQKARETAEKYK